MDLGIRGRHALVCGGSRGLGHAAAEALAVEGVSLTLVARHADQLRSAADDLAGRYGVSASIVGMILIAIITVILVKYRDKLIRYANSIMTIVLLVGFVVISLLVVYLFGPQVKALFEAQGFRDVKIVKDLGDRDRVVTNGLDPRVNPIPKD